VTRVNPVGWFIVAFFLIGGVAFWIALPWVGIGQIWVAVAVGVGLLYLWMGRRADRAESLRTAGAPGTAQILEMTQTGVYINENPQVKMRLRIDAQGIPPYEIEKRATVPLIALGMLGSGRPLTVYVDRADHENVFIDWSGGGAAVGAGGAPVTAGSGVPFTFSFEDGSTADISSDAAAQKEILDVLHANGMDPRRGTLDLRSNPRVREAVLDVLRRRGYGPAAGTPASPPALDHDGSSAERPGVDRLMELQQMKDKGLISDEDFEETKERILKSL
jgi:Short C-terminal domain